MHDRQLAKRALIGLALAASLLAAPVARAIDVDLPGERKLQIHGFYEFRLRTWGEDLPANGMTLSQFRQVLSVETELDILPEGAGPIDFMMGYARLLASYECVYRRGCGTFPGINSYGGEHRTAKRVPYNFKRQKTRKGSIGGAFPQRFFPGSLRTTGGITISSPGGRYSDCFIANNENVTGAFLGYLCNLDDRSKLVPPIDLFLPFTARTRAGSVNSSIAKNLLRAGRPELGRQRFDELNAYPVLDEQPDFTTGSSRFGAGVLNGQARAYLAERTRAQARGDSATVAAMNDRLDNLLSAPQKPITDPTHPNFGRGDPNSRVPWADTLNETSRFNELLATRPQADRYRPLLTVHGNGWDLTESLWAVSHFRDTGLSWTPTIDTPYIPTGYMRTPAVDTVSSVAIGMTESLTGLLGTDPVLNRLLQTDDINEAEPLFIGPDGRSFTADDLPVIQCGATGVNAGGQTWTTAPVAAVGGRCFYDSVDPNGNPITPDRTRLPGYDPVHDADLEPIYYLQSFTSGGQRLLAEGQDLVNLANQNGLTVEAQCAALVLPGQTASAPRAGGLNARGQCVQMSSQRRVQTNGTSTRGTVAALDRIQDPSFRPGTAVIEPANLTDLRLRARGGRIPARPRAPNGGLWFTTVGASNFFASHHGVVGNLDIDFTEDELAWEHGASQQEHEFREGYLEFELADSQVFARVGKLVMVWGKTELFRNQDRLNPVDIGLGTLSNLEESRVSQWAADVTFSPERFMRVGPVEDLRVELVAIFNQFTPTDLGQCGESLVFEQVCAKSNGTMASGLLGVGLLGEVSPSQDRSGIQQMDFGIRLEGRWDRVSFSISDFWGWDDGFYVEKVQTYTRRVDPTTGAPVNVFGALQCTVRTDANGVPVGPDNVPGNFDDQTPSIGNCLLYDNPADPNAVQRLRAEDQISLNHYANQTLFSLLCSLTFDADVGQCALDRPNDATLFPVIASSLAGRSGFVATPVEGAQLIRLAPDPADSLSEQTRTRFQEVGISRDTGVPRDIYVESIFGRVVPPPGQPASLSVALDPNQQALLGCGPRFATGCDDEHGSPVGGIDFLNTDASVQLEEFTILKWAQGTATSDPGAVDANGIPIGTRVGALVGTRNRAFEPGISTNGTDFATAIRNGAHASFIASRTDPNTGQFDPNNPIIPTDFQIEGMKWPADPYWLERDILVFMDPRDPATPINPLGEDCTTVFKGPDPGCTNLEIISANVERIVIGVEIIGRDQAFDPPETFAEMLAMLDTNVDTEIGFDPVSGPDGIRFADFDYDGNGIVQDGNLAGDQKGIVARQSNLVVVNSIDDCIAAGGTTLQACYRTLEGFIPGGFTQAPPSGILVGALPIGLRMRIRPEGQQGFTKELVEIPQLTPIQLQDLAAQKVLKVDASTLGFGGSFRGTDVNGDGIVELTLRIDNYTSTNAEVDLFGADIDNNGTRDLDEDEDDTFDFVDDGTPGPISDDNILCGSGIPGDILQDAMQYDFDDVQQKLLNDAGGLPPRSPVFCAAITGLINTTGFTRKDLRAGGDTRYGRRDFLWHGGEQLALNHQKKNVFGFGLDFAEDRTKTSWGLEFSWMSDRIYNNNLRADGISRSDEYVLSISVDRPTFFNFLNPNRSFFVNLQVFMRWIPDWQGSSDSKDGMYTVQSNEFSPGAVTLTVFTGYFQDRLNPRFTALWDPDSGTYALLTGVGYRWNDAFSTSFAVNHFFGSQKQQQVGLFPPLQNTFPDLTSAMFRGTAAVRNRDVAQLVVRYTF